MASAGSRRRAPGASSFAAKQQVRSVTPAIVLNAFSGHPGVARSLGRVGVDVHALHGHRGPARLSRYFRSVRPWSVNQGDDAALRELRELRARLDADPLLVPEDDFSLGFLERNAAALRDGFVFPQRPEGLAERLSNKRGMFDLCREQGIPTPATLFPASSREVEEALATMSFPVVLKGIDGERLRRKIGTSMVIAQSREELEEAYARLEDQHDPNLMLQEYIPGGPQSVWMLEAYFDRESRCLFGITGQKIRQYPPYTGMTSLGICIDNEEVRRLATRFMSALGYTGPLDCGFRYDARDGRYKLLDVNPRVGASFRLFVSDNDLDVVRSMYLDLTGQEVPSWQPVDGRKWLGERSDLAASLVYWRDGRLRPVDWLRSFRGVRETTWFARDDLRPFAAMLWQTAAAAAGRGGIAVRDR